MDFGKSTTNLALGPAGSSLTGEFSPNLVDWETVQQFQITHLGDYVTYLETNNLPRRFYKLNLAP